MKKSSSRFWLVVPVLLVLGAGFGFFLRESSGKVSKAASTEVTEKTETSSQEWDQTLSRRYESVIQNREFLPVLRQFLDDENPHIAFQAALALAQWGERDPRSLAILQARSFREGKQGVLAAAGLHLLGIDQKNNQRRMQDRLKSDNWITRRWAALALALAGDRDSLPLVLAAMKDNNLPVKVSVAQAAAELGDDSVLPFLRRELGSKDKAVALQAAEALAARGDQAATPRLKVVLAENYLPVRQRAARSLALLGDDSGLALLGKSLDSDDGWTRFRAWAYASEIALARRK